jgi:amino acid permease
MVFESILDTVGAVYSTIAGNIIGNVEKLSPNLAAWVQGFANVISLQGNARALALLAVVGLILGFIFFTIKLFCFNDDGCKGL